MQPVPHGTGQGATWLHCLSQASSVDRSSQDYKSLAHQWAITLKWVAKKRVQLKWDNSALGVRLGITQDHMNSHSLERPYEVPEMPHCISKTPPDYKRPVPLCLLDYFLDQEAGPSGT